MNDTSIVYLVDDDESVRVALARLLRAAGYRVESYDCAQAFLRNAEIDASPACVVLDVGLPDISGLELQRELDAALPIVFISGNGDIPMTVGAIKAGAMDFLAKPVQDEALLQAVGQALERSMQMSERRHDLELWRSRLARLTPREREVMALVVTGRLNKQVASDLGTVEKTIKAHRARVMQKMEVSSLAELVRVADKLGLPEGEEAALPHTLRV
jgi:FixJ family two-component response regulator